MRKLLVVPVACVLGAAVVRVDSAGAATAPRVEPKNDLRIVTMNILHGIICPNAPDDCQGDDRMALLGQQLQAAKCPPVVALEEIAPRTYDRVVAASWVKQCKYKIVWHDMPLTDRELVLTTLPVTGQKLTVLAGNFRSAYRVELRSKLGPVVLLAGFVRSTVLMSSRPLVHWAPVAGSHSGLPAARYESTQPSATTDW